MFRVHTSTTVIFHNSCIYFKDSISFYHSLILSGMKERGNIFLMFLGKNKYIKRETGSVQGKVKWSVQVNCQVVQWLEDSELSLPRVSLPPLLGELRPPQAVWITK